MAREKLHHLQELVKVVQQGGGPHLPIDDLEDLTLTLSEEIGESEYGESEEEGEKDLYWLERVLSNFGLVAVCLQN